MPIFRNFLMINQFDRISGIFICISHIFFEQHAGPGMIVPSMLLTLLYGLIMLYLNYIRRVDGPYPFFRVHNQSVKASVIWVLVLLALIGVISAGITVFSALVHVTGN